MNVDDKVEVDCILEQADTFVPDSSPELFRAVGLPQYTLYAQRDGTPTGEQRPSADQRRLFPGVPSTSFMWL